MFEEKIGVISHYFRKLNVAVIELSDSVSVSDHLHFNGANTDFEQRLDSMQLDHKEVTVAKLGDQIGIKVQNKVQAGDLVFKITD